MHHSLILSLILVSLGILPNALAYWITSQPHDATVALGETATFGVGLQSSPYYGYKYKWYVNERILSYTSSLSIVATEDLDNARIKVDIYDGKYKDKYLETSNTAFLRIKKPEPEPVSNTEVSLPSDVTAFSGEYIELSVNTPPHTVTGIQWSLDSVPLPGQNYPDLRMKVTTEHDNAELSVTVVGIAGMVRARTILHVYWAKWVIAIVAVAGGIVLAGLIGGAFVLKKRGLTFVKTKSVANYQPVEQEIDDAENQDPSSTELDLN